MNSATDVTGRPLRTHNMFGELATCARGTMSFSGSYANREYMNLLVAKLGVMIRTCDPSVGPFATRSLPMLAPEPGTFSTTVGTFQSAPSLSATIRPTISVTPPATNGTTNLIVMPIG